jgi:hypothetical protein
MPTQAEIDAAATAAEDAWTRYDPWPLIARKALDAAEAVRAGNLVTGNTPAWYRPSCKCGACADQRMTQTHAPLAVLGHD